MPCLEKEKAGLSEYREAGSLFDGRDKTRPTPFLVDDMHRPDVLGSDDPEATEIESHRE